MFGVAVYVASVYPADCANLCNGNLPKWRVVSVRPLAIEVSLIPSDTGLVVLWIKGPVNPYCLGIAQPFFV